ncbi:Zinc finger C2H2-type, partial [Trinorchestia longiramus]
EGTERPQEIQAITGGVPSYSGNKSHQCHICLRQYFQPEQLRRHMAYHKRVAGVKQHQCGMCGKLCAYASDLRKHMRTHTGEKPLMCRACEFCTGDPSALARHVRKYHELPG